MRIRTVPILTRSKFFPRTNSRPFVPVLPEQPSGYVPIMIRANWVLAIPDPWLELLLPNCPQCPYPVPGRRPLGIPRRKNVGMGSGG